MAKARVIIKRRKAVRNIRKITKVMQMIATSRYQKAYRRAVGTKPYVKKIGEMLGSVVASLEEAGQEVAHPLLQKHTEKAGRVAVLVLTSNRGLAGGYNGGVLRMANRVIHEIEAGGEKADVHVSGKKGIAYFKFAKRAMAETYTALGDNPKYAEVEKLADRFLEAYVEGKIDGLRVVYQQFISAGQQRPAVLDILPLSGLAGNGSDEAAKRRSDGGKGGTGVTTYDFSPEPVKLLEELIPITVKVSLFQAFIESAVSEQIARMVAMKAATDNADKMTKRLTQEYNRARQSQITSELSELMGGVEALK